MGKLSKSPVPAARANVETPASVISYMPPECPIYDVSVSEVQP